MTYSSCADPEEDRGSTTKLMAHFLVPFGERGFYISCGLRDLHQILFLLINVINTKIVGLFLPEQVIGFRLL